MSFDPQETHPVQYCNQEVFPTVAEKKFGIDPDSALSNETTPQSVFGHPLVFDRDGDLDLEFWGVERIEEDEEKPAKSTGP